MAIEIISEVWEKAPQDIKGVTLLVLLRLANSAGADHRMTWVGVDRIAREVRASKRAVYDALNRLEERGIIQTVADEDIPASAGRYEAVVRYITPSENWTASTADVSTSADSAAVDTSPDLCWDVSTQRPVVTSEKSAPKTSIKNSPTESSKRSYIPTGYSAHAPRARGRWRTLEPDPYNPQEVLFGDEDLPTVPARKRGEPHPDSGMGLALAFVRELQQHAPDLRRGIDVADRVKLAATFNRWKTNGTSPDTIRAMIRAYATVPGYRSDGPPPWRDFLAKRTLLLSHVEKTQRDRLMDPETYRPEDWMSESEPWLDENGEFDEARWRAEMLAEFRRKKR